MSTYSEREFKECVELAYRAGFGSGLEHVRDLIEILGFKEVAMLTLWLEHEAKIQAVSVIDLDRRLKEVRDGARARATP
jgi:hypothetical protein